MAVIEISPKVHTRQPDRCISNSGRDGARTRDLYHVEVAL